MTSAGVSNYGDDAILLSTLQRLQRIRQGCRVSVVSDGPACPPLGRFGVWLGTCEEYCRGLLPDVVRRDCQDDPLFARELSKLNLGTDPPRDLKCIRRRALRGRRQSEHLLAGLDRPAGGHRIRRPVPQGCPTS